MRQLPTSLILGFLLLLGSAEAKQKKDPAGARLPSVKKGSKPAPWLEAPLGEYDPSGDNGVAFGAGLVAVGSEAALLSSNLLLPDDHEIWLVAHRGRGMVGQLATPAKTIWVGLDGADAVYAANASGQLWRAATIDDALVAKGWKKVGKVTGAEKWVAGANLVIARKDRAAELHISTDGGATFSKRTPEAGGTVDQVFVRHDGLVVVGANDAQHGDVIKLSTDAGASFTASAFTTWYLGQVGSLILNPDGGREGRAMVWSDEAQDHVEGGARYEICPAAMLAADGKTWIERDDALYWEILQRLRAWDDLAQASEFPRDAAPLATAADPPAPKMPKGGNAISGAETKCPLPDDEGLGGVVGGWGGTRCSGVHCLAGTVGRRARETTTGFALFGDAAAMRAPHAMRADWKTGVVQVVDLPDGCKPQGLFQARGVGVLVCADALYVAGKKGGWTRELALDATLDPTRLEVGTDGTMLLHAGCPAEERYGAREDRACARVLARAPLAIGAKNAWRELKVDAQDLTFRALDGGRVLVVSSGAATRIALSIEGADGKRAAWMPEVTVEGEVVDVSVESGQVTLVTGYWKDERRWRVAAKGELVAVPAE